MIRTSTRYRHVWAWGHALDQVWPTCYIGIWGIGHAWYVVGHNIGEFRDMKYN